MIPVLGLFETHLMVNDLNRAMAFYGDVLKFELAHLFTERRVAFYWLGGPGVSMLGLWEAGSGPQRLSLHIAFRTELAQVLDAPRWLAARGITPLGFNREPCNEPS